MNNAIPRWLDVIVLPLISLCIAFFVTGLIVVSIGVNPFELAWVMIEGSFLNINDFGFTLYYATTYIFTGLAVAVAFHAGLFNIGGEGQATIAAIGVGFVALWLGGTHWAITLPIAILASMAFGAFWALIPAYMQAERGSHIVITTIMMNFIAAAILSYVVVYVVVSDVSGAAESARFGDGAQLPRGADFLSALGLDIMRPSVYLNIMFPIAIFACWVVYMLIWRSRLGYEIRAFGYSGTAAQYAGISSTRIILVAMMISGALAGLMANNTLLGGQLKLDLTPVGGAGFLGIAVALMGRNHPVGIVLAAILFGALKQAGTNLRFDFPEVSNDIVFVIQGLVILFVGALDNMVRIPITRAWVRRHKEKTA